MENKIRHIFLVLGILFLAALLRFYALDKYPPGLYPDEAVNTTDVIRAMEEGDLKLYYPNNNGREGLFLNLFVISQKLGGINIYTVRFVSAFIGLLTVFFIYLLGKEVWGASAGLVSSFLVAISYWHLNFSRINFRAIFVPLILAASFYFLFRGYRKLFEKTERFFKLQFFLAGLIFGVGFHTYIAFRIAPAIIVVFFGLIFFCYWRFKESSLKKLFFSGIIFLSGCLLTASPILFSFLKNPEYLNARQNDNSISVLDPRNNQGDLFLTVSKTLGITLGQFFYRGDSNWRHNLPADPLLSPFVSLMFLAGFFYLAGNFLKNFFIFCFKFKKKDFFETENFTHSPNFVIYGTLLAWFFVMLSPAFLTVEGLPHALRSIGSIPTVFLIAAIPITALLDKKIKFPSLRFRKKALFLNILQKTAFCALIVTLFYNSFRYFYVWGESPQAAEAFEKRLVEIGKYLKASGNEKRRYLIVNQDSKEISTGFPVSLETIRFFNYPSSEHVVYLKKDGWDNIDTTLPYEIIIQKEDRELIEQIEKKYSIKAEIIDPDPKKRGEEFIVLR